MLVTPSDEPDRQARLGVMAIGQRPAGRLESDGQANGRAADDGSEAPQVAPGSMVECTRLLEVFLIRNVCQQTMRRAGPRRFEFHTKSWLSSRYQWLDAIRRPTWSTEVMTSLRTGGRG